jgi:membrane protein YqaA with SNARE-associated domain
VPESGFTLAWATDVWGLDVWGLAISAFLAATVLPGGSEVVLLYLVSQGEHSPWLLVGVASFANTLGSMSSWALGRWLPQNRNFEQRHARALAWLRRRGAVALLMAWVPVVGDPLCLAAGWLRIRLVPALLFTALGKTARYAALSFWI